MSDPLSLWLLILVVERAAGCASSCVGASCRALSSGGHVSSCCYSAWPACLVLLGVPHQVGVARLLFSLQMPLPLGAVLDKTLSACICAPLSRSLQPQRRAATLASWAASMLRNVLVKLLTRGEASGGEGCTCAGPRVAAIRIWTSSPSRRGCCCCALPLTAKTFHLSCSPFT